MRIVFAGSADLACPTLDALLRNDAHTLCAVVTQPDRPRGRRLRMASSPVGAFVQATGVPVLKPANINATESLAKIGALDPDVLVVIAYGQFLGSRLLALPRRGCINLHASLLPAYRGAAPIQWAIAEGETETGVTVMYLNERMDAGDILMQRAIPIRDDDDAGTVHDRLARLGPALVLKTLDAIAEGTAEPRIQDESKATYARKLKKEDGRIDWGRPARELHNHVRGFHPWPGCHCVFEDAKGNARLLKVYRARPEQGAGTPGMILEHGAEGPLVATGKGALRLLVVQPSGGIRMSGSDFLHGHKLNVGDRLK